jgi:hypothetical protein
MWYIIDAINAPSKITLTHLVTISGNKPYPPKNEYAGDILNITTVDNPTQNPEQSIQLINLPKKADLPSTHVLKGLNNLLCTIIDVTP